MLQIEQVNTVLYCEKWQATVAFYRDTLCLPVAMQNDWFVEFQLGATNFVSVANARRATIDSSRGAGITLTWRVQDVAATRNSLIERGVSMTPLKKRFGAVVTYFRDPEGNRIELWEAIA